MNSQNFIKNQLYRFDLINFLIEIYGYKTYLEIGVNIGESFEKVICQSKTGVDPDKKYEKLTHQMTSDQFFEKNSNKYDIIFIDGLHQSDQVIKDVENSLNVLNPKGTIVMHDCLPYEEIQQSREPVFGAWTGDVWKAFAHFRSNPDLFMMTLDTDMGLGIIKRGKQEIFEIPSDLNYNYFVKNKYKLMNIKFPTHGIQILKNLQKNGF